MHLTEADLGALYNKASSPKLSPTVSYFLTSLLIIISTVPSSFFIKIYISLRKGKNKPIKKKQEAF